MNIFATEYYKSVPPHLNNAATLPCETKMCVFVKILMLEKRNSKHFYILTLILLIEKDAAF